MTARTLSAMNRQLEHMVRLIDDLLDVSRISRGTLEMRREHVDLSSVIDRAIETARPFFTRRNQSIEVDAREPLTVFVDATRIAQIVGNLLNNASKHSPLGAQVRIELTREFDRATIRVVDEGAGIPLGQLERVFDMFTKIERSSPGTNDGLGIGLALSRQLADLHGASLEAASGGEGKGATFTLSMPIGAAESIAEARQEKAVRVPVVQPGLSVVVVEDNEDSAEMMAVWLEQLGHEVRIARTGPDGVALVLESRPHVVLCDIGLPGMDGADVCRRIVGEMSIPPVMIALTGWGMEGDRRRTAEAGFNHHLVKPVALDQLRAVLDSVSAISRGGSRAGASVAPARAP
jgi:CheY-like chemotaxis protein/two-component sensor histidine kinase